MLRRLLSMAVLAAAVVGIPIVIDATGGPPPTGLPSADVLTQTVSDHDIIRVVAMAGWLIWLLFAVAVIVEVVAHARHRPSPGNDHVGLRIPLLQGMAAALILTAFLSGPTRSAPTPGRMPAPTTLVATASVAPAATPAVAAPAGPASGPVTGTRVAYTVVRYDSPWAIAATHLGSGLRWTEILDEHGASLVDGRGMVPTPDGPAMEDTARTIYPGQILSLPPDATGLPPPSPPSPPAPPPPAIAPLAGPPPSTVWSGSMTTTPIGLTAAIWPDGDAERATASTTALPGSPTGDLVLGGALLASAAVNILTFRRARQTARSRQGEQVPLPADAAATTEARLRARADAGLVATAGHAMVAVVEATRRSDGPPPDVAALLLGDGQVEVVLRTAAEVPSPWSGDSNCRRWRSSVRDLDLPASRAGLELYPALVPIGTVRASGAHVLINLEMTPITALCGDRTEATAILQAMAVGLAGLPWSSTADVVLVGFGQLLATCRAHVRSVAALGDVAVELRATSAAGPPMHGASLAAARARRGGEGLTPTILLIGTSPDAADLALLQEVCRADTTVRAVVIGDVPGSHRLDLQADGVHSPVLTDVIEPAGLADLESTGLDELLRVALSDPVRAEVPTEPPSSLHLDDRDPHDDRPAEPVVTVQVLGAIEFGGLVSEFRRPQAKEVLTYLALHRPGVAEHQLDSAVWPERPNVKATTRDPVVSAARSAAGGPDQLPFAHGQGPDKRYRVTATVGTDWDRFRRLHRQGRSGRSIDPLVDALRLVRGRPFADVLAGPGYGWLHLEGHLHHVEAEIVDAADLAAEILLEGGDAVGARWAANQGLLASPYTERLWSRLMAVADALGEAQQVERILAEMDRRLDLEGDFSQLHPDTLAAYRRYSRRAPHRPSPPPWR